jgi:aryl sulfotransferase
MNRFVWLASYPKSGNTWFRVFLTNFLRDGDVPVNINDLADAPMASARAPFDTAVGYDSSNLRPDEIERLRPEVYLHLARQATEPIYCKIHDAFTALPDGRTLVPSKATRCAVYFVRNPLDVCVSFAQHAGHADFARTIREMADPEFCVSTSDGAQLPQRLFTWSEHVASWTERPDFSVKLIRYEDMNLKPEETFAAAVRFLGLPDDPVRVRKAMAFSGFEEMRRQEERGGFAEKPPGAKTFFRQGGVGSWRGVLSAAQVQRVIADHREVMMRMGYLTPAGEPVF